MQLVFPLCSVLLVHTDVNQSLKYSLCLLGLYLDSRLNSSSFLHVLGADPHYGSVPEARAHNIPSLPCCLLAIRNTCSLNYWALQYLIGRVMLIPLKPCLVPHLEHFFFSVTQTVVFSFPLLFHLRHKLIVFLSPIVTSMYSKYLHLTVNKPGEVCCQNWIRH